MALQNYFRDHPAVIAKLIELVFDPTTRRNRYKCHSYWHLSKQLIKDHFDIFYVLERGVLNSWMRLKGTMDAPRFPQPTQYFIKSVELGRRTNSHWRSRKQQLALPGERGLQKQKDAVIKAIRRY